MKAAGDRAQSSRRSPPAPNADRRCSGTSEFGLRLIGASVLYRLQLGFRLTLARAKSIPAQGGHKPVGIKDGVAFEHEIDGAGQLDGQHCIGLELIVQARFQALRQRAKDLMIAFGHHGGFAKGPAQIFKDAGKPQTRGFSVRLAL